jgi:hypothetical protein
VFVADRLVAADLAYENVIAGTAFDRSVEAVAGQRIA